MPTQHDRKVQLTSGSPQRSATTTAFAVLRRHRGTLARATGRVVGLSGLAGLLMTAAIFALAWPVFTRMRNQRIWYHHVEDPYLHDHTDLALVALCTLPSSWPSSAPAAPPCRPCVPGRWQPRLKDLRKRTGHLMRARRGCDRYSACTRCAP